MSQEVLLYTQNFQAARQEIESLGGRVTHQFTNRVFVALFPHSVSSLALRKSSSTAPDDLDEAAKMTAQAWQAVGKKVELGVPDLKRGLAWDAPGYKPPRKLLAEQEALDNRIRSTGTPTSLYMTGSIAVGIVIVSGSSNTVTFDADTPVTALSRKPDHIDLFAVGTEVTPPGTPGRTMVYTTWWDGAWHQWGTVGSKTFPPNTPIAAISRREDHIDLFAVGEDNAGGTTVYTAWWDGIWHDWQPVGNTQNAFPRLTPITALARRADHIDLFGVGQDGLVRTNWWDDTDDTWHNWGIVGAQTFPVNTPIAAIARKPDHIDLFAVGTNAPTGRSMVFTTWWDGDWHDWRTVGNQAFPVDTPVTAIARREDHIDLFAVGSNGRVHTTWWDGSWNNWATVGDQRFQTGTTITALARKPDHIDLFAVGDFVLPDGTAVTTVCSTWWNDIDDTWSDWGRVNDTNDGFLNRRPIAAIARHSEQIDLFGVQPNGALYTTWWNKDWHSWAPIGGDLRITDAERQTVIAEVQEGLNFLATERPQANISFVYDFHFIEVDAAPGDISDTEAAEAPWRNAALQQMGFAGNRQGSVDYVNQLRQAMGTDWAYVGYFTKYQLEHFAYAGRERICMEYANGNWGSNDINRVFAHETCHIFGADDEYQSSGCECGSRHGYLSVPNNNCLNCSGAHEICLMDANDLVLCRWSQGQIGWGDPLLGFQPNTPITSLARRPEHIDVFVVGADGAVYTNWWSETWHNWGQVGSSSGLFPAQTPITAIARRTDHIDLFAIGNDGRVYTNWWSSENWHEWGTVGSQLFPAQTPIAAIARRENHIDLFAVGEDGAGGTSVYTAWWDGSWHDWRRVNDTHDHFPLLTRITAIARKRNHIDLFAVGTDGRVYTNWWDGSWHDWGTVGEGVFIPLTPVTAIARKLDHIDLFAVGLDGQIYTNWWSDSWHEWGTVGNALFTQLTPVTAIARKSDHIDLFAVGQNGLVYTNWWSDSWHEWGTVDTDGFTQLTPISALSRKSDHIDLFAVAPNGAVSTNWWSGSWQEWAPISNVAPTFRLTTTQLPPIEGTEGQVPTISALLLTQSVIYATHYFTPDFFQHATIPGELVALDRSTLAPIQRVGVGMSPRAIALHQATNYLYVVNYQNATISVIDAASFAVADTLQIPGSGLLAAAVSQKYHRIFVTQPGQKRIIVIDAKTRTLLDPMMDLPINGEVVIDEVTDRLYTLVKHPTNTALQELIEFEINTQGQTEVRRATLDGQVSRASEMAVDANRLYVINKDPQINPPLNHQQLTILDRNTLSVVASLPLHSRSGIDVAISDTQNVIYITSQYHIQEFDATTLSLLRMIPHTAYQADPYQPQATIAVDELTGVAYFGGAGSSTLVQHFELPA